MSSERYRLPSPHPSGDGGAPDARSGDQPPARGAARLPRVPPAKEPAGEAPGVDHTARLPPGRPQHTAEPDPAPGAGRTMLAFGRELTVVVVVAVVLSLLIKTFLLQPFWIPSGSMNNTLIYGDRVIVSKLTPGPFDLQRGDVIVFTDPGGWLDEPVAHHGPVVKALQFVGLYPAGDNHLIKRLIGLPGDHVKCCTRKGLITVNGVAIHEPYVRPGDPPSMKKFDITVPPGKVWVMGDHRSNSGDSRYHDDGTGRTGSVPEKDITGRAVAIVWPFDRMTWLSNYSTTFDKVPHP